MSGSNYNYLANPAVAAPDFYLHSIQGLQAYRDQQAQLATSQAYQQSIDPQTGALNQGKFNALLASTPQGAWNIGPSMQQAGQAQTAQGVGQQQQMEATRQQLSGISAYLQPLLQKTLGPNPQPVTGADVLSTLNQMPDGLVTPQMKANVQKQVTAIGGPTGDATSVVRGANFATMTAQEQLKTLYPSTQPVNLGSTVQPYQPSPLAPGGAGFTGGGVGAPTSASPDTTIQPHPVWVAHPDEPGGGHYGFATTGQLAGGSGAGGSDGGPPLSKDAALDHFALRESGMQNIPNRQGPGGRPASSASGYWQIEDPTWREGAGLAGVDTAKYPTAMSAPYNVQRQVAGALYDKYGGQPWAASAPPGGGGGPPAVRVAGPGAGTPPATPPAAATPTPPPSAGAATQFRYPNGKIGGAPDAQGGVHYTDGNYGTPPVGRPIPIAPAPAPAAASAQPPATGPAPAATTASPPVRPPSSPYAAQPPMGAPERVRADIDAYTKDASTAVAHQNSINTLNNAYKALQLADTGPGTQNLQAARAFLQSYGITTAAQGDETTQWAEAHKYLMDYARTQGLLGGTDLQAQLAQGSNASTDIPKPAALAVVRNNIAKERLAMAQVQNAPGSSGYVDYSKSFASSQDLRAYQADVMPPQELKQIFALKQSNPAAFKKFEDSLNLARRLGMISDADLAAQNQRMHNIGPS